MDEFDDDDFGDLYGDIEVQTSSAISSMHGMAQIIQGKNSVPDCGAEGLTQFPTEIPKNAIVGEEQGNGLGETEIAAGNGDICRDKVVFGEEGRGLITLPSEDCDTPGSDSEDEYDAGSDGDKEMLEVDYDVAGECSEGGEGMKNGYQSYGDSLSHQEYMGPQSAVFSSNSDDSYRSGTDLVDNDRKQLINRTPVVGRDSSNSPIPQSRDSTHASAFPPPNFDKHGAVHISDSEEDNEAYGCDSDGIVELSRSGRSQRDHHFSSSSSPSVEHGNDDKGQSCKRLKNNSSGPVIDVRRSASCNTKNGLYSQRERTLVTRRSNDVHNQRSFLNENVTPFGFDVSVPFDSHQWAISHGNQRAMFGHGPIWQNMPYCQAPETYFPYFGGFLPGEHLPQAYLNNNYWNIYPGFRHEASQLNVHNMDGNSNFLEKKVTEMDKALKDKRTYNDRRPAIENKVLINVDDSKKFTAEYSHAEDKRGAQFSNRENDNQFKSSRERDHRPLLRDQGGDFMKEKNRKFLPRSDRDKHCVDHRDERISHDRKEVERHGRGNDRYHSPLKKSDNPSQLENGDNRRRFFKNQCVDHRDDRISHDRKEVERHGRGNDRHHNPLKKSYNSSQLENGDNRRRFFKSQSFDHRNDRISHDRREVERHERGNDRYHSPLEKSDNSLQLENGDNHRQYFKSRPSPFQSFEEPRASSGGRFKGAFRPKFDTPERYFKFISKEGDTSKNLRYCEGREHLQERRHYEQHADTFNSTGIIKFYHNKNDFWKRKHHQLSRVLHQDERYNSRHPNEILCSEVPLFHSEKISRTMRTDDRYTSDSVTGFIDRRDVENTTYKLEKEGGYSSHLELGLRSARPDRSTHVRPQYQDSLAHSVVTEKIPPEKMDSCYKGKIHCKQVDENLHKKSSDNQQNKFLDIEEGQIIPEEFVRQNNGLDDQKIQQIIAKMERRKERFKESIAVKCETEKNSKPLTNLDVEIMESEVKVERPSRKRKWAGN